MEQNLQGKKWFWASKDLLQVAYVPVPTLVEYEQERSTSS